VNLAEKRNEQGQAELLTVMLFDATNRRHYENDLLLARRTAEEATQTERLAREVAERANRAKDEFLALISHELRTPLGAILGWSQVLRRPGSSAKDLEHGLSVIERNARLQARLVDDLLDMSRIVSGKLRLDVQRVDLAEVIEAAVQTAQPAAQAREIRIQKILDHQIVVAGDPGRLQQVFWNLFSNAVKFTPTGGSVRVVTERVESHVEVSVIDTGQGMSAEFLAHAFERFRQSDSAPTQKTGGLGLGLSIVRHLVEMHGGTVEARSDGEGKGATFVVKLPLIAVHPSSERKVHPRSAIAGSGAVVAPVDLRGARVLIVDDEPDARELLAQVLAEAGAEVVSAGTAQAGLDALAQSRPDVLVSDIGLPDADGYDFIRRARMRGESATTPALALTAFSSMEDRTRAMLAGYQMHLAKPVDAHEFLVTVASLCGRLLPPASGRD
jgi:signal transduction histidine kinase